jgi:hypothetical protein
MLQKFILFALLAGLLSGCALPGSEAAPTPYPADYLPTVIYLTAESLNGTMAAETAAAITPTDTPTDTPTPITPTLAPTDTPTPAPGIPLAAIRISAPGPTSKIASPLEVRLTAIAGKSNKVEIDLFGEDGRLLGRTVRAVPGHQSGDYLFVKIPFEIRAVSETGILQVSTKDEHGRVQSLNSVRVFLFSSGASQINPAGNAIYERAVLYHLPPRSSVSGGVLDLEGQYLPYNRQDLVLELIADDGRILGQRLLSVPGMTQQDFTTTIPYKVSGTIHARLFLHQADDVVEGQAYVYSQEITLNP